MLWGMCGCCRARGAAVPFADGLTLLSSPLLSSVSLCPSCSTASNSNRSTPACSPILRKRSRSPTPQDSPGDAMVEKGSDHSSDKSPSTPEQGVQRSCSSQSGRSGAKNSKVRGEPRAAATACARCWTCAALNCALPFVSLPDSPPSSHIVFLKVLLTWVRLQHGSECTAFCSQGSVPWEALWF